MGDFKLEEVPATEFPTVGRSFADKILDNFLDQSSIVVRVVLYSDEGKKITHIPPSLPASTLKTRVIERQLNVDVGVKSGYMYLRKR